MNNFEKKINHYMELTENGIKSYYNTWGRHMNSKHINLIDAMNYYLRSGGKRIRPILVFAFCEALGGRLECATAPACAIEMLHTFSLIHDDLPAMDNSDFRRGKPSCHKKFNEAIAILAGDALAVLPFEIIADAPEISSDKKVLIISVLANSIGVNGMICGQAIDIELDGVTTIDEDMLRNMYYCKTGQLFAASCVIGAICANAENYTTKAASEYGFKLGFAFQIIDDILDITSTTEKLGKSNDVKQNKATFVTLFGIEKAKKLANNVISEAIELLDVIQNNDFLKKFTDIILKREK